MDTAQEETNSASHPPYSEMILAAITELGEKEGSSKQAISKQIEATYGDHLQADHPLVLSHSLQDLKESGKLLFIRNNYLKPDAQPRRGRGRPPKPKTDLPEGAEPQSPKKQPAKKKDPASASAGKKRGRPPKNLKANGDSDPVVVGAVPKGLKRGRGRPPKEKERSTAIEVSVE